MADERKTQMDRLAELEMQNAELMRKLAVAEAKLNTPPPAFPENTMLRCEQTGGHLVKPKTWPPTDVIGAVSPNNQPSMALKCERCGCWVIVYDRPQASVRVVKPEPVEAR